MYTKRWQHLHDFLLSVIPAVFLQSNLSIVFPLTSSSLAGSPSFFVFSLKFSFLCPICIFYFLCRQHKQLSMNSNPVFRQNVILWCYFTVLVFWVMTGALSTSLRQGGGYICALCALLLKSNRILFIFWVVLQNEPKMCTCVHWVKYNNNNLHSWVIWCIEEM